MPSQVITPAAVAKQLSCSTDTVRRYSATYAERLSAGANPGQGKARTFTAEDLAILRIIRDATVAGAGITEIRAMLATVTLPAVTEEPANDAPAELATTGPEAVLALMRQLTNTMDRLAEGDRLRDESDRRVDELRAEVEQLRGVAGEVDQLRTVVTEIQQRPAPATPPPALPTWVVYMLGILAVAGVIAAAAVVVWLLGQN